MSIEIVRVSERTKIHLIIIKRKTGIQNWNVICRWGFCLSLSDPSIPPAEKLQRDSSIEMTWKIFGGVNADIYYALLVQRCKKDGFKLTTSRLNEQFKLHLQRGIAYLVGNPNMKSLSTLLALIEKGGNVQS
ncbi:MAG: DNA sulfur modification protein DndE [Thiomargarita sp.]|nr:DNA sulfur modification protein DndE [Thiomargarita sp.]